jgi:hypothetical protein
MDKERQLTNPDLKYRYRTARDAALNPKHFTGTRTGSGSYGTVPIFLESNKIKEEGTSLAGGWLYFGFHQKWSKFCI